MGTAEKRRGQFGVGDRVVASCHLGGLLRRRVIRGTSGTVSAVVDSRTLHVEFDGGVELDIDSTDVDPDEQGLDESRERV